MTDKSILLISGKEKQVQIPYKNGEVDNLSLFLVNWPVSERLVVQNDLSERSFFLKRTPFDNEKR